MKVFVATLLCTQASVWGFTLTSSNPPRYPDGKIVVRVGDHTCANASVTAAQIETIIQEGIERSWNRVYSAAIDMTVGEQVTITNGNNASQTDILTASAGTINVACTDDSFSSTSTLAQATIGTVNGVTTGVVMINDMNGTSFASAGQNERELVLAHEIGHAIGLGHSALDYALMYYQTGSTFNSLSEDDADGATYLYPHEDKFGGFFGHCGQITTKTKGEGGPASHWPSFFLSLVLGSLMAFIFFRPKKLRRVF